MSRFQVYCAVYLALMSEGKVFLLRRANTDYKDGYWCMPSGHVESGEDPEQAAVREAEEEAGVIVSTTDVEFAYSMFRKGYGGKGRTYSDFMFVTEKWQNEPFNNEPEKASEWAWFDIDNLPEQMIEAQRTMLVEYLQGIHYKAISENEL